MRSVQTPTLKTWRRKSISYVLQDPRLLPVKTNKFIDVHPGCHIILAQNIDINGGKEKLTEKISMLNVESVLNCNHKRNFPGNAKEDGTVNTQKLNRRIA